MNREKNLQIQTLIQELKITAAKNDAAIWRKIAADLEKPHRQRRQVNVFKIEQYTKENETVIVPGKVLGMGNLTKKVSVAAYTFSKDAYDKISVKGECLTIQELIAKNPKGKDIKILG